MLGSELPNLLSEVFQPIESLSTIKVLNKRVSNGEVIIGLEIDQFDVERVEIIKGPGSLQYGSDGLGGVINIMPDKLLPKNSFKGSVLGVYKTNNDHWGSSANLGFNIEDWFLTARYSARNLPIMVCPVLHSFIILLNYL